MAINFKNINQIKKYLPPKGKWTSIMKDDSIAIDKKILLNGLRYVYVSNMITEIKEDTSVRKLKIIPTGSKNLSSDIDIQVLLNLSMPVKQGFFSHVIDMITKHVKIADDIWGEFPNRLDVNYYPFGLFNFVSGRSRDHPRFDGLLISPTTKMCCWVPVLKNKDLAYDFLKVDTGRVNKKYKPNLKKFYELHKGNVQTSFFQLYNDYKNETLEIVEHNKHILNLTKYNEIGPEMYFSVGSIIFVVWYIQLGNKMNSDLIKYLSIPSYLENKILYERTGKDKYKYRMDISKKCTDKKMMKRLEID